MSLRPNRAAASAAGGTSYYAPPQPGGAAGGTTTTASPYASYGNNYHHQGYGAGGAGYQYQGYGGGGSTGGSSAYGGYAGGATAPVYTSSSADDKDKTRKRNKGGGNNSGNNLTNIPALIGGALAVLFFISTLHYRGKAYQITRLLNVDTIQQAITTYNKVHDELHEVRREKRDLQKKLEAEMQEWEAHRNHLHQEIEEVKHAHDHVQAKLEDHHYEAEERKERMKSRDRAWANSVEILQDYTQRESKRMVIDRCVYACYLGCYRLPQSLGEFNTRILPLTCFPLGLILSLVCVLFLH
jgi:hypothetical protein